MARVKTQKRCVRIIELSLFMLIYEYVFYDICSKISTLHRTTTKNLDEHGNFKRHVKNSLSS